MCSPCFNVLKGFCCSKPPPPPPQPSYEESLFHPTQPLFGAIMLLVIACGIVATPLKLWLRSARIGDLANAFVLVNTGGFLAVVLANNAGLIDWLSPSFSREGASRASSNTQELSNRKASNVNDYTLTSPVHDLPRA